MVAVRARASGDGGAGRRSCRGYILVILLAFIVSMGIFLTVAMPNVATEVQRDQEEELIFRGEAIAAAIRAYKAKTGGYPLSLDDLAKIRPRIIRKAYRDPMTQEGDWDLVTAVQPGTSGDTTGLPIVGVRSRCTKDSFKVYQDKTLVSEWTFSAADNLLGIPGANAAATAAQALGVTLPAQVTGQTGATPKAPAGPGVDIDSLPTGPGTPPQNPPDTQNPAPSMNSQNPQN